MVNIWEKFDKEIDLQGLKQDVEEAGKKSGQFEELPLGDYEVALSSMELKETKETKKPMITSTFEVIAGDKSGRLIFVNQVIETGVQISIGMNFLNSLTPDEENTLEFDGYAKLFEDLKPYEEHVKNNFEYVINVDKNKKDYNVYKIKEIFELE